MKGAFVLIFALVVITACKVTKQAQQLVRLNDLEKQIQSYGFVPFKIPRTGDGAGTIITFQNKNEAVISSKNECLPDVSVDTVFNLVPNYSYTLSNNDTTGLDLGKIFGDKLELSAGYKNNRVKKINVTLISPFEARFTRTAVFRQVDSIKKKDALCTKNLYGKNNYLIERVFGIRGIDITLQDSSGRKIAFDADILKEITSDANLQRQFQGKSEMKSSMLVLLGYRTWKFEGTPGFGNTSEQVKEIDIETTLKTREASN